MKRLAFTLLFVSSVTLAGDAQAATCTPTGFFRDTINMTAAVIDPPGTVTGTVDATGCNIGVYFGTHGGTVDRADIRGANYFGILVNADNNPIGKVVISRSMIHAIGEVPHNGTQHGVAIYLRGFANPIKASIQNNWVFDYQKGGIVANGPGTTATITDNQVLGDGHVTFTAQNGIQVGYGAGAEVAGNTVIGNSYIGFPGDGSASGGILAVGGPGYGTCPPLGAPCSYTKRVQIRENTILNNDAGVYLSNLDSAGNSPASPTENLVVNNWIYLDKCFNTSYQAGISDMGNGDKMLGNVVFGPGYIGPCVPPPLYGIYAIDVDYAINPTVKPPDGKKDHDDKHDNKDKDKGKGDDKDKKEK